jgi:hypothetical protein
MSGSWVISHFSANDLNGQTVEFRVPGKYSSIQGIGIFEARQLSGRRVVTRIRLDVSADWTRKEPTVFRIPQEGCRQIEIHPNPGRSPLPAVCNLKIETVLPHIGTQRFPSEPQSIAGYRLPVPQCASNTLASANPPITKAARVSRSPQVSLSSRLSFTGHRVERMKPFLGWTLKTARFTPN